MGNNPVEKALELLYGIIIDRLAIHLKSEIEEGAKKPPRPDPDDSLELDSRD